jgi:hypothetical protein
VTERFPDLTFDRSTGILKGRGGEIALPPNTVAIFAALWRARGEIVPISEQFGRHHTYNATRKLRGIVARFGLTVRGERGRFCGGYRLVDLQDQNEKVTS